MFEVRNGGDAVWEAEAKIGRAKAYLVGSPYATDFGFSNVLQGPLQAGLAQSTQCRGSRSFQAGFWGYRSRISTRI